MRFCLHGPKNYATDFGSCQQHLHPRTFHHNNPRGAPADAVSVPGTRGKAPSPGTRGKAASPYGVGSPPLHLQPGILVGDDLIRRDLIAVFVDYSARESERDGGRG